MAKYSIEEATLTAIADSVRTLDGVSDKLTTAQMSGNIDLACIEVDKQADLIEQIQSTLFAKNGEAIGRAFVDRTITTLASEEITSIRAYCFAGCTKLQALILRNTNVVALANTNAFQSTPIASGNGFVYVPAALVDSYKAATNWTTYANKIRSIEDYPNVAGD